MDCTPEHVKEQN